jgi:farnesyl-diphosphate farnesyltransferase
VHYNNETGRQSLDPSDPRTRIVQVEQERDAQLAKKKRAENHRNGIANGATNGHAEKMEVKEISTGELMMYVCAAFVVVMAISLSIVWGLIKYTGDT